MFLSLALIFALVCFSRSPLVHNFQWNGTTNPERDVAESVAQALKEQQERKSLSPFSKRNARNALYENDVYMYEVETARIIALSKGNFFPAENALNNPQGSRTLPIFIIQRRTDVVRYPPGVNAREIMRCANYVDRRSLRISPYISSSISQGTFLAKFQPTKRAMQGSQSFGLSNGCTIGEIATLQ